MDPCRRAPPPRLALLAAVLAALPAAAAGPPAGVGDREVVFGNASAFSGASKELGRQTKIGIETALLAANEQGGVHGRLLRLVAADHGDDPSRALAVVKEWVEGRKVLAFVGNTGSAAVEAYHDYLLQRQVLLLGPLSGALFRRNDPPDRYVFNVRASDAEEAAAAVRYLVGVRRIPATAIAFLGPEDASGDSGFKGVAWQLRRYGVDPGQVVRAGYPRGSTDPSEAVRRIQQSPRVQAVVCFAPHRLAARLVERLQPRGLVFTLASAAGAQELADELRQLGPRQVRDVVLTQVVPSPTGGSPAAVRYREQLRRHFPAERPDFVSLHGWLAGQVAIEGLRRAGRDLDTERLVEALEGLRGLDLGTGSPVSFGPSEHQASHRVWGFRLEPAGAWSPLDLE
jgi:ABC-type branched-subunit amino acid transport system substrate-binding protein